MACVKGTLVLPPSRHSVLIFNSAHQYHWTPQSQRSQPPAEPQQWSCSQPLRRHRGSHINDHIHIRCRSNSSYSSNHEAHHHDAAGIDHHHPSCPTSLPILRLLPRVWSLARVV